MKERQCVGCQHLDKGHWCKWFNREACTVPDCPACDDTEDEGE
jgi:hypothetical protein